MCTVVTLIAMKREVAAMNFAGFSVERMSSYETGDKSLYSIAEMFAALKYNFR